MRLSHGLYATPHCSGIQDFCVGEPKSIRQQAEIGAAGQILETKAEQDPTGKSEKLDRLCPGEDRI